MPEISVIIVNWNGRHFLPDCLSALRQQTFHDFETIFVDNGSTDGSLEFVRAHYPEVRIISLESNHGFSEGNIAGYREASGNTIVLLNNDTEAHPDWLDAIHRACHEFPSAGSFACKMMYFNDRTRIENCGFQIDSAGIAAELGRDQFDGPEWAVSREVFGACGGAVAYRRRMLEAVGFLDPDFFMIYEDVDLGLRAQLSGFRCVYVPKAVVYHHYRSTIKKRPALQIYYSQRNIDFVYWKNLPLAFILRSTPRRLLYELGSALYFFRFGAGVPFLRAKLDVLRRLPSVLKKRRVIQKQRSLANSQLRTLMCGSVFNSKWKKFFSAGVAVPSSASDTAPGRKQVTAPLPGRS
ncbi:MAG TPA: glycosyltransferase family 2 protein [Candidatus Acidoferrales bacterium]|nr:glycosyltransferase family 2 protein [Candidatus Acidoferrales bacterium]